MTQTTHEAPWNQADSPSSSTDQSDSSVKDRAADAKDEGMKVAATAKDEAMNVVAETRRQAGDLLKEATSQIQEQTGAQKGKAAEGLRALGEELQTMAGGGATGPASDLVHQASDKISQLADWLDNNDPSTLMEEARNLARRKPGQFLIGALAAGVVAGRVTRGMQGAASAPSSPASSRPKAPSVVGQASPPRQLPPIHAAASGMGANSGTPTMATPAAPTMAFDSTVVPR
ncbi:MAG: hypothetical protein ACT4PP_03840 [Sporichthyaceae bacterium]